jgi:[protein-PII] uridylyltransferase
VAEFLVLHHLLMSHTAQRRDLSDPHLIEEFARTVEDTERLTSLYLLTYADISSVGPKMWNEWKARLLRELFLKARDFLTSGQASQGVHEGAARAQFRALWTAAFGPKAAERLEQSFSDRYFSTTAKAEATLHARLLSRAMARPLAAFVTHRAAAGFSALHLAAKDRHGLLSLVAGVLAAHRIDVLRARIESTRDGFALDVFDVRTAHGPWLDRQRWRRARTDLVRVLTGAATVDQLLAKRQGSPSLKRPSPKVSTKVSVDNRASRHFTVVDVRAEDRLGLLHDITSALAQGQADIALANVVTEGNKAIDSFYVTRTGSKVTDREDVDRLIAAIERAVEQRSSNA